MKPRIFIGSSKEGLEVAQHVKLKLNDDFDCYLWTDGIFQYNISFLDTLLKEASLFDFGILIATKDDYTSSRGNLFETPRDNVIFEFGLFIGRLGPSRAFLIQEMDAKLPTDMLGVTVPQFERGNSISSSESLNSEVERISRIVKEKIHLGELGLLPSTALAIGYFYNFVSMVCEYLQSNSSISTDNGAFKKFELNIIIPNDLDADIKKRSAVYYKYHNLKELKLDTFGRSFPVFITVDGRDAKTLKLYDMPTTLSGIDKCIELYMQKGHIGKTTQQKLLEERELANFERTLQNLINNDAFCRSITKIIRE